MNWFLTIVFTIFAYFFITLFGSRSGEQSTAINAATTMWRNPVDFIISVLGTCMFGLATYNGIKASPYGVTIVISLGLIVSFALSTYWGSTPVTLRNVAGIAMILLGAWLLQ